MSSSHNKETCHSTKNHETLDETGSVEVRSIVSGSKSGATARKVHLLPQNLDIQTTGLETSAHQALANKQKLLKSSISDLLKGLPSSQLHLLRAASSTLVFAQEEAGTAICVSPEGLLLTCSHCVAEDAGAYERLQHEEVKQWLLFADGRAVQTRCVKWDPKRDIALLEIVAAQQPVRIEAPRDQDRGTLIPLVPSGRATRSRTAAKSEAKSWTSHPLAEEFMTFPFISFSPSPPQIQAQLICIGHPGPYDLETKSRRQVRTNYDVLEVSSGVFEGYTEGQDIQDNSEIGALKHSCWTYWGHSGSPLVLAGVYENGEGVEVESCLVGLHSSWDEETTGRRGVGWEAIDAFLKEFNEEKKATK
ncbi:hypothetical protein K402DRAFT_388956 [Aulographum hederae CBS 113979]|uniref:Trypsin-like serine protease n=1 Tax=Aulographum hederae CBS 113979 TaxID=1176131 RepID=A0A6G1HEW0_9PEZI|nr:hypothetical protein K402DRAFT_388956 [Aulographum hederae CBS 113979]